MSILPDDASDDALARVRGLAAALDDRVDSVAHDVDAALERQERELTRGFRAQLAGVLAELAAERARSAPSVLAGGGCGDGGGAQWSADDATALRERADNAHIAMLALRERVRQLEAENTELRVAGEMWARERRALIRATADARRAADDLERQGASAAAAGLTTH